MAASSNPSSHGSSGGNRLKELLEERNYELLGELGRGGMGIVYLARHKKLGRKVALKTLSPDRASKENSLRRFEREARVFAQIRHPHIATLYEFDGDGPIQYLALEYIDGCDLESERRRSRRWSPEEAARIVQTVCTALDYTHRQGVLHRDIKPGNILIEAETNRVVLTDFGLAKSETDETLTAAGFAVGTPAYMAPEQITDQYGPEPDGRADLFSLGTVFYEMLVGEHPFLGSDDLKTMRAIVHSSPRPLTEMDPAVPESLERIVFRMLEKDPARRHSDAGAAAADLAKWLAKREAEGGLDTVTIPPPSQGATPSSATIAVERSAATAPAPTPAAEPRKGLSMPVVAGIVVGALLLGAAGMLAVISLLRG